MTALAVALSAVLLLVTSLHVYWAIGGIWPGTDRASCARAVVGLRGVDDMPSSFAGFAVAACLCLVTLWPLALAGVFASPFQMPGLVAVAVMIGLVFLARGVLGFVPAWRRLASEQPFATWDVRYYSPLCLALGAGFVALAIMEIPA